MSQSDVDWHLARVLQSHDGPSELALLVLNQPLRSNATLRKLWRSATLRVAADGGANRLHNLTSFRGKFSNLHAIIGDLDSLDDSVRDFYASQPTPAEIIHDLDQESTDFSKAVKWIRKKHPAGIDIVILGGIGGRVDQGIRQLHELYLFQTEPDYDSGSLYLLSGSSLTILLKSGSHRIHVREDFEVDVFGKHVGIIPLKEPSRISTRGLEWDVQDWETCIGGNLSTNNQVKPETRSIEVDTSKDVLFTIALAQVDTEDDA